jgi:hypothetical protein
VEQGAASSRSRHAGPPGFNRKFSHAHRYLERRGALFDELDRENQLFEQSVQAQFAGGRACRPMSLHPGRQEAAEIADRRDELAKSPNPKRP